MACRSVSALAPTDVPTELAISLAPFATATRTEAYEPRMLRRPSLVGLQQRDSNEGPHQSDTAARGRLSGRAYGPSARPDSLRLDGPRLVAAPPLGCCGRTHWVAMTAMAQPATTRPTAYKPSVVYLCLGLCHHGASSKREVHLTPHGQSSEHSVASASSSLATSTSSSCIKDVMRGGDGQQQQRAAVSRSSEEWSAAASSS